MSALSQVDMRHPDWEYDPNRWPLRRWIRAAYRAECEASRSRARCEWTEQILTALDTARPLAFMRIAPIELKGRKP